MTGFIVYTDSFETTGDITPKQRTYEAIKARVLECGEFSVFEATENSRNASIFSKLHKDPEIEVFDKQFPWIGVRKREVA